MKGIEGTTPLGEGAGSLQPSSRRMSAEPEVDVEALLPCYIVNSSIPNNRESRRKHS